MFSIFAFSQLFKQVYSSVRSSFGSNLLKESFHNISTKVGTTEEVLQMMKEKYNEKSINILCYYNSDINMIVQDQFLMQMPIDDRIINRSHGVFDSLTIHKFKIIKMKYHLERFKFSASALGITIPFEQQQLVNLFEDMTVVAYNKLKSKYNKQSLTDLTLMLRFWLSSGKGDFGIYSYNKKPILYSVVYVSTVPVSQLQSQGVKEYSYVQNDINEKITRAKSTNYVENSIMANLAKAKGGYQGIKLTSEKYVLEAAMSNLGFFMKNKDFVICPPENIVQGTTLLKSLEFIKSDLIKQDIVKQLVVRHITIQEVISDSQEVISFGGNKVIPITEVDDQKISDGQIGEVCKKIQSWYGQFMNEEELLLKDKENYNDVYEKVFSNEN